MSDTARKDEIDEVMASVRILVSQKETTTGAADTVASAERLMLTPALRVAGLEDDSPAQQPTENDTAKVGEDAPVLDIMAPPGRVDLETTIAELEDAVAAQTEDWEPDDGEQFDEAAWAASAFRHQDEPPSERGSDMLQDDAETLGMSDIETGDPAPADVGTDEIASQDASADDPLAAAMAADPESLRTMVAQIVHEELAGALGERMTRSVRKLVRREIAKALVSRGLD